MFFSVYFLVPSRDCDNSWVHKFHAKLDFVFFIFAVLTCWTLKLGKLGFIVSHFYLSIFNTISTA